MGAQVKIIRASDAFLYLPLYIAEQYGVFGSVQGPKAEYAFSSERTGTEGDANAVRAMHSLVGQGQLAVALCDPLAIYSCTEINVDDLVVFGAILKRPPFWIVDGNPVESVEGLRLKKFVTYGDSLVTGAALGKFVAHRTDPPLRDEDLIRVGVVGDEIDRLIKLKEGGQEGAGALTVDVLGLAQAQQRGGIKGCQPILYLGGLAEFNHFVTTAFVTTRHVCKDHPDLLRMVVEAMKRATTVMRGAPGVAAKVIRELSAHDFFAGQRKLVEGEATPAELGHDASQWLAELIVHDNLFTMHTAISRVDWHEAARIRYEARALAQVEKLYDKVVIDDKLDQETTFLAVGSVVPEAGMREIRTQLRRAIYWFSVAMAFGIFALASGAFLPDEQPMRIAGHILAGLSLLSTFIGLLRLRQWASWKASLYSMLRSVIVLSTSPKRWWAWLIAAIIVTGGAIFLLNRPEDYWGLVTNILAEIIILLVAIGVAAFALRFGSSKD